MEYLREVILTSNINPGIYLSFHGACVIPMKVDDTVLYPLITTELTDKRVIKELEKISSKHNVIVLVNRDDGTKKISRSILDTLVTLSKDYPVLIPYAFIEEAPQISGDLLGIIRYMDPKLLENLIRNSKEVLYELCRGSKECVRSIVNLAIYHGASHVSMLRIPLGLTHEDSIIVEENDICNYGLNKKHITNEVLPKYRMRYLLVLYNYYQGKATRNLSEAILFVPRRPVLYIPIDRDEPEEVIKIIKFVYSKNITEKNDTLYCSFL